MNLKNAIRDRVKARYKEAPKEEKGGGVQAVRDALAALETALAACIPDYKPKK